MSRTFLNLNATDVIAHAHAAVAAAAGGPVVVRVGDEVHGYRYVGVDLPRARCSAAEGRRLLNRASAALEGAGIVMAPTAEAPRIEGDILGNVRVREVAATGATRRALHDHRHLRGMGEDPGTVEAGSADIIGLKSSRGAGLRARIGRAASGGSAVRGARAPSAIGPQ